MGDNRVRAEIYRIKWRRYILEVRNGKVVTRVITCNWRRHSQHSVKIRNMKRITSNDT